MEANFWNFDHSKTFPEATWGPTQNLGLIGSAILNFIGYKQTNRQTNRQTDKPNLYIDEDVLCQVLYLNEDTVFYWNIDK